METSSSASTVSRRDFIRTSAAAAASVSAFGALGRGVHAAGSDTLRLGLIGCGGQGTRDMDACLKTVPGVELVAMGDMFADRMQTSLEILKKDPVAAAKVKVKPETCFTGFEACMQVLASGVDAVLLVAPPHFRPVHFRAAVEAGKHIFMEKPAAVDPAGVRSMIETAGLADKKGVTVVCGTQRRHQPMYQETVKRIQDGAIGTIVAAEAYWMGGDMLGYWKWYEQGNLSGIEWQIRNWPWYVWLSGDHVVEQHVHNLDVINWVLGKYPVQCLGMGSRAVRNLGNIWDNFTVMFDYPDNIRLTSMSRQINNCMNRIGERIVGTKGFADVDKGKISGANAWEYPGQDREAKAMEQEFFIKTIRDGKPVNEAREMAKSTLGAIMGRMSAYSGRAISWDWALDKSKLDMTPPAYKPGELPIEPVAVPGLSQLS